MPHIIVEYSQSLEAQIPQLLPDMHEALVEQGVERARLKTRATLLNHAVVGDKGLNGQMLHATLLILAGRDGPTKKKFGDALHTVMKETVSPECAVTLEIRDMDPDTYYL